MNAASCIDNLGFLARFGNKSLHARSHGELFMSARLDKLHGNSLSIKDEPETALSPIPQLAALAAVHDLVNDDSQFITATHSPILLAYRNAKILKFSESGIFEITHEETERYIVAIDFFNNYLSEKCVVVGR